MIKFAGWLSAALFALAVVAFDGSQTYAAEDSWRSGGTLHLARQPEWMPASHENKLATTSDFVVEFIGQENAASISSDELKEMSEKVISCVERKIQSTWVRGGLLVWPNAMYCMITMDYPPAGSWATLGQR